MMKTQKLPSRLSLLVLLVLITGCIQNNAPASTLPASPTGSVATLPQPAHTASSPTISSEPTLVPTAQPGALTGLEPGWWNDAIFYELFVRSFKDSDGDGIGDFNGVTESLDYLNDGDPTTTTDLGITALWLMPIMQSPSYHGYDVVDYYAVDDEYGTQQDFLRMVEEAHKRGIRVIVDLVLNHTGLDHPWFKASDSGDPQYRDWYIWQKEDPGFLGPWSQDVWYPGKDGYYYAVFWSGMPDLNLENPAVTAELYKITEFWLKDMNVDGFRLDAIRHFVEQGRVQENTNQTHAWLQAFHQFYKSLDPSVFTVGEAWTDTASVVDYIGDEVDLAFEFDLAGAFVRAANGPIASAASNQLEVVLQTYPKGQYGVFLTNHDQDRVMSVLGGDFQKAKLAAVMLLTAPGVPFLYYGEEIGMTGTKPDEDIRRPMQWTSQDPGVGFTTGQPWRLPASDFSTTNVAAQSADPDSLLNLYRQLLHLRNAHPALRTGETLIISPGTQRIYAILRYDENEAFLILINAHPTTLNPELYDLSLESGPFKGSLNVTTIYGLQNPAGPAINAAGGFDSYQPFAEIPPHSATILQLKP
jgi:alpha-amylase